MTRDALERRAGAAAGLPLSLQLAGRAVDEATILRLAHADQGASEWQARRPRAA